MISNNSIFKKRNLVELNLNIEFEKQKNTIIFDFSNLPTLNKFRFKPKLNTLNPMIVVTEHYPLIKQVARKYAYSCRQDADDLAQHGFIYILENFHKYISIEGDPNLRSWIRTVVKNEFLNIISRNKKLPILYERDLQPKDENEHYIKIENMHNQDWQPEEEMEINAILLSLEKIPDILKDIIKLCIEPNEEMQRIQDKQLENKRVAKELGANVRGLNVNKTQMRAVCSILNMSMKDLHKHVDDLQARISGALGKPFSALNHLKYILFS